MAVFSARCPIDLGTQLILVYKRLLLKSFRNVSQPLRVQMHCRLAESTLGLQGIPQFNRWGDLLAILNHFLQSIQSVISHHYLFQSQPQRPFLFKLDLHGHHLHDNTPRVFTWNQWKSSSTPFLEDKPSRHPPLCLLHCFPPCLPQAPLVSG